MMILHPFHISSTGTDFPEKMNNPFDYEPHPLCIQICKELQTYLENKKEWREEIDRGKMFGVLIVEGGYLAAYSGQIGGRSDWDDFVPAVFDYLQPDGYFKTHEAEITHINESILRLEKDERMQKARTLIADLLAQRQQAIAGFQEKMKEKTTFSEIKNCVRSTLEPFLYKKTHRNPIVIPVILNSKQTMEELQKNRKSFHARKPRTKTS